MTSTIVGYFNNTSDARRAEQELISAGFQGNVQRVERGTDGMQMTEGSTLESWWDRMKMALGFEDERELSYYQQATREGGSLVTVRVADQETSRAADIMERYHPNDLDQRPENSQVGLQKTLPGISAGASQSQAMRDQEATIPLTEEELQVGKRTVQRGALRIHTYVTERPVEEQVTLREEKAYVERRPANRAVAPGDAAFQERSIDVEEMAEEAVVSKKARVVEEVVVGKQQTAHTETVRDKIRKTEVEVDRDTDVKRPSR